MSRRNPTARIRRELMRARATIARYAMTEATLPAVEISSAILRGLLGANVDAKLARHALLLAFASIDRAEADLVSRSVPASVEVH